MLAILGYGMVITFMVLIMSKRMTAFTALVLTPIVFGLIGGFGLDLGKFALTGVKSLAPTAVMLLFAILYFGLMINVGLFDPLVNWIVKVVKGDPLKVIVGTAIMSAVVSLDGDGSTTIMIVVSAMLPLYKRLKINPLILASILIMQNSIMNIIPWGGPTARVMSVLNLDVKEIMAPFIPAMILAVLYVIGVAYYIGKRERKKLGITHLDQKTMDEMASTVSEEELALKRPKLLWVNFIMTILVMVALIKEVAPSSIIFLVAAALALLINYPSIKTQRDLIDMHAGNALQVVVMVLAAGVFMGILTESGMADAIAENLISIIPESMGSHFPLITAIISIPGTFFLSNDAFYFGILPVLAETGAVYGFSSLQIGVASLMGQAFHLLSPLVGSIYLLLQLTDVDMGEWQRYVAKWAIGIFAIFVATAVVIGFMPL
ncbi:CitMHS family transporter [Clostridium sp.]|uniref:CitMHS family transporter n=1 Tax=Clostridium sp. TaxID=1506 RepID=UPI0034648EBE